MGDWSNFDFNNNFNFSDLMLQNKDDNHDTCSVKLQQLFESEN